MEVPDLAYKMAWFGSEGFLEENYIIFCTQKLLSLVSWWLRFGNQSSLHITSQMHREPSSGHGFKDKNNYIPRIPVIGHTPKLCGTYFTITFARYPILQGLMVLCSDSPNSPVDRNWQICAQTYMAKCRWKNLSGGICVSTVQFFQPSYVWQFS